jgi:hypothetical protein
MAEENKVNNVVGHVVKLTSFKYLTRIVDISEVEQNCNKLYQLGYRTTALSEAGSGRKLILAERIEQSQSPMNKRSGR